MYVFWEEWANLDGRFVTFERNTIRAHYTAKHFKPGDASQRQDAPLTRDHPLPYPLLPPIALSLLLGGIPNPVLTPWLEAALRMWALSLFPAGLLLWPWPFIISSWRGCFHWWCRSLPVAIPPRLNTTLYGAESPPRALTPAAARWFILLSFQPAAEDPLTWPRQNFPTIHGVSKSN